MSRFSEHPSAFVPRRSGGFELTAQEQATIFAAREILARHINRNPVLSSWQAVMDYCALSVRGEVERFHVLYRTERTGSFPTNALASALSIMCRSIRAKSSGAPWTSMLRP